MKKLIVILIALFAVIAIHAQSATVIPYGPNELDAITLNGQVADTIEFPAIPGEYDLSMQLIPATYGVGTSVSFTYYIYQSNSYSANAWTQIGSQYTVTTTTDGDAKTTITDFKGLRLRSICLGTSTDTITVQPYMVAKKHADE